MKSTWNVRHGARALTIPFACSLIVLAAGLTLPVQAQSSAPTNATAESPATAPLSKTGAELSLEQAVELALGRHPDLAMARHEVEAAMGATEQAGVLPNPSLSVSVEDTRKATRTTAYQLNQLIELGGKRSSRVQASQLLEELNRAQLQGRVLQIRSRVRSAFWDMLAAQSRLGLARQSNELAQAVLDAASKRVAAGKVSPVEETRARVALSGVVMETAQAQQDLVAAKSRLGALIGLPAEQLPELVGAILVPAQAPAPADLARLIESAPDTVQAAIEVKRRNALVDVERSKAVPDVTIGVGRQRNNEMGRDQTLLSVAVPLPLFDRNQGNLREAIARSDQARDDARGRKLILTTDVQIAASRLDNARQQALLAQERLLPDATRTYEATTQGFTLGKFGFLDVLDAQRTLFQARAQHLKALSDAQQAASDLEALLGAPLSVSNNPSTPAPSADARLISRETEK